MFFFLSKVLDILLSPLSWGLGLIAFAIPWRRQFTRRRRVLCGIGLGLLLLFSLAPISNALLFSLEHATTPTFHADKTYDAVVLLGGITDERVVAEVGQPAYNENVERLVATRRLLAENHARFVIVSGAAEDPAFAEYGEARVLAKQLVEWGIDPARILLEERARNTHENALFSYDVAKAHALVTLLVVTSAYHMRRAAECFAALPTDVTFDTYAVDYRAHRGGTNLLPRANYLAESTMTIREFFGLYVYRARGYAKH